MRRNEILLNLVLLVIIGTLVFLMYESRDLPRTLDELEAPVTTVKAPAKSSAKRSGKKSSGATTGTAELDGDGDGDSDGSADSAEGAASKAPGAETSYAGGKGKPASADKKTTASTKKTVASDKKTTASARKTTGTEVAQAGDGTDGEFGRRNIFRALLTPTPTPPPPTPTPAPTPDINQALGAWRLLSVYQGKAMIEDVKMSAEEAEGAIWEMSQGGSKQVDVGSGVMKTATLKKIDNENPYNPEIVFSLEGTSAERKINLDTEPVAAPAAPKAK